MPVSDAKMPLEEMAHPFFRNLKRPSSPNTWLVAPHGFPGNPDERAPVFRVPVDRLRAAFAKVVGDLKGVKEVRRDGDFTCYVAETAMLHFKDDVCVQFLPVGKGSSTLAVYSASRVGYWDFGTNRRRLRDWIARLRHIVAGDSARAGQVTSASRMTMESGTPRSHRMM